MRKRWKPPRKPCPGCGRMMPYGGSGGFFKHKCIPVVFDINLECAALLKCRYAGRYDDLGQSGFERPTTSDEQRASSARVPREVFLSLAARGLVTPGSRPRLTDAGRDYLARAEPPRDFPVTHPDLNAPDGAVVDGYERVDDRWVRR